MGSSKKAHDCLAIETCKAAWNKTHSDENALPADVLETNAKPRPRPWPITKVTSLEHSRDNTGSSDKQVEQEAVEDMAIEALMTMSQWRKDTNKEKLADNIFKQVMNVGDEEEGPSGNESEKDAHQMYSNQTCF